MSKVSDIPFNKITDMIISITSARSDSRITLLRELNEIKSVLRIIEWDKEEVRKQKEAKKK